MAARRRTACRPRFCILRAWHGLKLLITSANKINIGQNERQPQLTCHQCRVDQAFSLVIQATTHTDTEGADWLVHLRAPPRVTKATKGERRAPRRGRASRESGTRKVCYSMEYHIVLLFEKTSVTVVCACGVGSVRYGTVSILQDECGADMTRLCRITITLTPLVHTSPVSSTAASCGFERSALW